MQIIITVDTDQRKKVVRAAKLIAECLRDTPEKLPTTVVMIPEDLDIKHMLDSEIIEVV